MLKFGRLLIKNSSHSRCINTHLKQGSLTLHFLEYLNENSESKRTTSKVAMMSEKAQANDQQTIQKIDRECLKKLLKNPLKLDIREIFNCLDYIAQFMPNQVSRLKFYEEALNLLVQNERVSENEFVRLCYYIAFFKKNQPGPRYLSILLDRHLERALDRPLTRTDLAIVSTSSFKTSVRITNKRFHDRVIGEILDTKDSNERYILIAFVKSLRHNRIYSSQVLDKLSQIIGESDFDYEPLVHILPYVCEHGTDNENFIEIICERCIKSFNQQSRAKDLQKFLHSCALLNLKIGRKVLGRLEELVLERTRTEEFRTHFDHFVNAALSLWILGHHSQRLIATLFEDERFYKTGPHNRVRLDSRMALLKTCVEIERPVWLKGNFPATPSFKADRVAPGYLHRHSLEKVMNTEFKNEGASYVQQIQNLNIAGILSKASKDGRVIHHEVLDEQTSLADNKSPNGIFSLKLRLLEKKKCEHRIVSVL